MGALVFTSFVKAVQCDGIKLKAIEVEGFGSGGCLVKFVRTQRQSERQAEKSRLCVSVRLSVCHPFLPSIQLSYAENKFHLEFCPLNQNSWVVNFSSVNKETSPLTSGKSYTI